MEFSRSFRRVAFALVTLVTGLTLSLGPLQPALAQSPNIPVPVTGGGMFVAVTANLPEAANSTYKNIMSQLTRAGVVALTNALQLFLGQMAYDAAEYIATGGKGQGKLFFDGKFGEYLSNVGSDAAGEFMASMSDSSFFQGIGFNLCQPKDPTTLLRLQVSLGELGSQLFPTPPNLNLPNVGGLAQSRYNRPQARCDFQTVLSNYDTLYRTMSDGDVISNLQQSFDPGTSQLGTLTSTFNRFLTDTQRQVTDAASQRQEGGGFRPLEGLISGNIRTPASVIEEATNEQVVRKPGADQSMVVGNILSNAWEAGPIQLAQYTASIFLNTLTSKFMQRIFEKGLGGSFTPSARLDLSGPDSVAIYGKTDARNANIDLKNPPAQQVASYDVVSQMQTCLVTQRGAWNCVMDQSLVQAIRSVTKEGGVTVREALSRGWLHGDWRLIPETRTRENQDPQCYTQAYCAGNLQKMRLMRILPIGFELAANSEANKRRCDTADGCLKLEEVAKAFTNCNAQGQLDEAHPFCHLIDPNWVITSFPQQCTLTGYTDTLVSTKLPIRKEECQDIQTCLARNDKGECTGGYGYCMAERPVYRFQADVCPAYAASCRIYTDASNKQLGYLRNTIDRAACDASNAGCLWYATTRATGTSEGADWAANTSTGNRMYFKAAAPSQSPATKGLDSCPAGDEGCSRLYAFTPGKATLNLLINGSFEAVDPTTSTHLLGWNILLSDAVEPPPLYSLAPMVTSTDLVDTAYLGEKGYLLQRDVRPDVLVQSMKVGGGRTYAFSFYARSKAGAAFVQFDLLPTKGATNNAGGLTTTELGRVYRSGMEVVGGRVGASFRKALGAELSQEWQRFDYSFVLPSSTQTLHLQMNGNNAIIDAVQLEEGEYATGFIDTFTAGLPAVFMKIAPDELQCAKPASDTTRSPLCTAFAQSCNQLDAGCQGYRDQEGGQEVPAILSQNDLCPAMCVGYSEYRKSASSFDLVKDIDPRFSDPEEATSTYFIPRTAGQCTQQDVGCEAFTVVDETGRTDGGTATYSYLRACEKTGADSETYFTWEGADTVGYQLRTWSLKKDTGPFDLGPRILTKIQADQISFKEPDTCNEASWRTAADPDCRQFYDARGRIYYRYFSQTILSTNECIDLRLARSNRADCERTGGRFNDRSECTYGAFLPESRSCQARATSCRMFTGANSGNSQLVLSQSFRDEITPFESAGVLASSEALLVGDKSLRVGDPGGVGFARARAPFASQETALYRATFWAKVPATSTTMVVRTSAENGAGEAVIGTVRLTPEWQRFTVGLFEGAPNASTTLLTFSGPLLRGAGYGFFLDEVSVVRVQDVVYIRNNTWTTPAQCDQGIDGADEPQAMLNCKAYTNRLNQAVNARRFTRLCREEAIGCTAFIDTRNTDETYGREIVQPNPIDPLRHLPTVIKLPADRILYLIDDLNKRCDAQNMSCRAFGKPKLSPDRQTLDSEKPYETVYFKDDITRYKSALCKPSEAYCAEYKYGSVKEYFRDPGISVCEYRESEVLSGGAGPAETRLAGWYVKDSAETPCYPDILEGGNAYGLARSGDATYKGYVGTCEEAAGECTELRDINDTSDPTRRGGKSYFYIKNDRLDTSSCNGTVDVGRGCVLFRDMSSGALNFNARASYEKYRAEGYKPVTPVDCRNNPENPLCNQPGRCVGTRTTIDRSSVSDGLIDRLVENVSSEPWVGVSECRTDDDCRDIVANTGSLTYRSGLTTDPSFIRSVTTSTRSIVTRSTCNAVTPERANDANLLLKTSVDRECSQWLGCRSSETVLDPSTNRYVEICSVPALCDKGTGQAGDQFCASYVDRSSTTTEPFLTKGAVLDAKHYASRSMGLGQKDYSGYSIPNAFQVMDLQSVRVAVDGAKTVADAPYRLSQDYRLTAAVSMPPIVRVPVMVGGVSTVRYSHTERPTSIQAKILGEYRDPRSPSIAGVTDVSDGLLITNPTLLLCKHLASGRIGYFRSNEIAPGKPVNCYLPVRSNSDLLDFQNVAEKFSLADPTSNGFLTQAYPPAECRAQPEQDAPFPASFTTEWDTTKNPAKPVRRLSGFATANTCEFGEDCSCTYKRVEYENVPVSKFYNQFSNASPPGICVGGPRDGRACIPGKIFNAGSNAAPAGAETPPGGASGGGAAGSRVNAIAEANSEQLCGPPEMGGTCQAFKSVTIVTGIFGQCLERDLTRTLGATKDMTPCLTWNPTRLLVGDKDPYHYTPSSGYMPPQNSGQYYCLSNAKAPKTVTMGADYFYRQSPTAPYSGGITKLDFDDDYVSDAAEVGTDGNKAGSVISGGQPRGSNVAYECENTDDDQDNGNNDADAGALRLINTGKGANRQYTESFFRIAPQSFANTFYGRTGTYTSDEQILALSDQSIGYFGFSPIQSRNSTARLGCGYNQDWVDNITTPDYDEISEVRPADQQWQRQFNADFSGVLTRSNETLITQPARAENLLRAGCVETIPGAYPSSAQCFFKAWEVGYRTDPADSKTKFIGLSRQPASTEGVIPPSDSIVAPLRKFEDLRITPYYGKCDSTKPYFSIRAVFQSKAETTDLTDTPVVGFSASSRRWTLAGFWVTACGGAGADEHFVYLYPRLEYADVCKELAEVVSTNSRQNAAYTDRVWKDGTFTIPMLGITYSSRYSPFSSALNTRSVGKDPLFQTSQEVTGYSPLNPPTFLAAGYRTYYSGVRGAPKDKWAFLTNIFARVYRIYDYKPYSIGVRDTACLAGPNLGKKCAPDAQGRSAACGLNGVCSTAALEQSDAGSQGALRCNALSGLNAGLTCLTGGNAEACHLAPIQVSERGTALRRLPCLTQPGWTKQPTGNWRNGTAAEVTQEQAGFQGAFRCPGSPVSLRRDGAGRAQWGVYTALTNSTSGLQGAKCFDPTDQGEDLLPSTECPERIINGMELPVESGAAPRMFARCLAPDGRPITGGQVGRCQINIPGYTIRKDSKRLQMPEFVVNATDSASPYISECREEQECWFTSMNFWMQPPFSLSTNEQRSFAQSYMSQRSEMLASDDSVDDYSAHNGNCLSTNPYEVCVGRTIYRFLVNFGGGVVRAGGLWTYNVNQELNTRDGGRPTLLELNPDVNNGWNQTRELRYPGAEAESVSGLGDVPGTTYNYTLYKIGACVVPGSTPSLRSGRGLCVGGTLDGRACQTANANRDCQGTTDTALNNDMSRCGAVATEGSNGTWNPVTECRAVDTLPPSLQPYGTPGVDLNTDNNVCTHELGYVPRKDLCPNPKDEFCGLIAYNVRRPVDSIARAVDEVTTVRFPTDVTLGLHRLGYLLGNTSLASYDAIYIPRPPVVAAPDIQSCSTPGKCAVQGVNKISLNGLSEGVVSVPSSQAKTTMRFYAWAAHNQMPLRSIMIDWGDNQQQKISDGKIKNHKPYCGARKECVITRGASVGEAISQKIETLGLTCNTDNDCPVGGGKCQSIGTCREKTGIQCSVDKECQSDSTDKDVCQIRTMFGNSPEACEENYFEFTHLYTCGGPTSLPLCSSTGFTRTAPGQPTAIYRCERDPSRGCNPANSGTLTDGCAPGDRCIADLAPAGGCWDDQVQTCRFTPKVMVQDNWGWCTGECRAARDSGGAPMDERDATRAGSSLPIALHPYGGCYSAIPAGSSEVIRDNLSTPDEAVTFENECNDNFPSRAKPSMRPWIVYPGSINLRSNR